MPFIIISSVKTPCLLETGEIKFGFRYKSTSYVHLINRSEVLALMRKNRSRYYRVALFRLSVLGSYVFHREIEHIPIKYSQLQLFD